LAGAAWWIMAYQAGQLLLIDGEVEASRFCGTHWQTIKIINFNCNLQVDKICWIMIKEKGRE